MNHDLFIMDILHVYNNQQRSNISTQSIEFTSMSYQKHNLLIVIKIQLWRIGCSNRLAVLLNFKANTDLFDGNRYFPYWIWYFLQTFILNDKF